METKIGSYYAAMAAFLMTIVDIGYFHWLSPQAQLFADYLLSIFPQNTSSWFINPGSIFFFVGMIIVFLVDLVIYFFIFFVIIIAVQKLFFSGRRI